MHLFLAGSARLLVPIRSAPTLYHKLSQCSHWSSATGGFVFTSASDPWSLFCCTCGISFYVGSSRLRDNIALIANWLIGFSFVGSSPQKGSNNLPWDCALYSAIIRCHMWWRLGGKGVPNSNPDSNQPRSQKSGRTQPIPNSL